MLKREKADAESRISGLIYGVPGYVILASIFVFTSHLAFDLLLGKYPLHERYETLVDVLLAVPATLVVFLLLRREQLRRVRVEKDRAASERRLTHILENASDAIIGVGQDHRIFLFNRGAELIFGYRQTEVCGLDIQTLLPLVSYGLNPPDVPPPGTIAVSAEARGERHETTARRCDGTEFPAEISLSRLEENGRTLLTIVLRDVTRWKEAEAALQRVNRELEARVEERTNQLREEREKLTRILDALPDGISVIGQGGQIEYLNPALERDFGPVAGRRCHEYLHERHDECADCPGSFVKAHGILSAEWHSTRTGKTYERIRVPLVSSGGQLARLEILHDITKRLSAERERERLRVEIDTHRRLFQAIVQNATVSIAVFDGTQFRLMWANPSYREILNEKFRKGDITGLRLDEIIPFAAESGLMNLFREVAASGQPHHDPEYEYQGFERGTTYWQWSLLPLPETGQERPDLLLLATEITATVRVRKGGEELRAEAERRTRDLSALVNLSQEVNATLDLQRRFELILEQLQVSFDCSGAAILLLDEGKMTTAAHRGLLPEERDPGISVTLKRALDFDNALNRREPLIVTDLWNEDVVAQEGRKAGEESPLPPLAVSRSWMIAPMLVKDRVLGLLRLEHSRPGHFTRDHARLALAMANHAAMAIESARLYREARKVAALEERQRLARELHDSVSQALYAIALGAHTAKEVLGRDSGRVGETLDSILALAGSAVNEMRFLIFELRPEYLENEALSTTLARLADAVRSRYGCDVRLEPFPELDLPLDLKEGLYRICHEALTNTARHARAGAATIRICEDKGQVALVVEDHGIGFETGGSFPGHLGLQSMRERAAELGGVLEIESSPGKGTLVRARFPRTAGHAELVREYHDHG